MTGAVAAVANVVATALHQQEAKARQLASANSDAIAGMVWLQLAEMHELDLGNCTKAEIAGTEQEA